MYDSKGTIKKYNSIYDIFDEYYITRYSLYVNRKKYQLECLKYELDVHNSKLRFIEDVIDEKIIVFRKKKDTIIESLKGLEYPMIIDKKINTKYNLENVKTGFNYLIQIPLYHLSEEKIVELENIITDLQNRYDELNMKTIEEIWFDELKELKKSL